MQQFMQSTKFNQDPMSFESIMDDIKTFVRDTSIPVVFYAAEKKPIEEYNWYYIENPEYEYCFIDKGLLSLKFSEEEINNLLDNGNLVELEFVEELKVEVENSKLVLYLKLKDFNTFYRFKTINDVCCASVESMENLDGLLEFDFNDIDLNNIQVKAIQHYPKVSNGNAYMTGRVKTSPMEIYNYDTKASKSSKESKIQELLHSEVRDENTMFQGLQAFNVADRNEIIKRVSNYFKLIKRVERKNCELLTDIYTEEELYFFDDNTFRQIFKENLGFDYEELSQLSLKECENMINLGLEE